MFLTLSKCNMLRVSEDVENEGLDAGEHGSAAYHYGDSSITQPVSYGKTEGALGQK